MCWSWKSRIPNTSQSLIKNIPCNKSINSSLNIDFDYNDILHESIKITDLFELKMRLLLLIPQSARVIDFRDGIKSKNDLQSYDAIRIIKNTFENIGCAFEYENTTDSPIDIYINGLSCQCKTTSRFGGKLYGCSSYKLINNKKIPYNKDDFEYFIVQIIDSNDPNKYKFDMCIIPTSVLADKKIVQTDKQMGIESFKICPPQYIEYH